jgi:hypothetical protein
MRETAMQEMAEVGLYKISSVEKQDVAWVDAPKENGVVMRGKAQLVDNCVREAEGYSGRVISWTCFGSTGRTY